MIKNVSKEQVTLRWSGETVVLNPGETLSVEKRFNADPKQAVFLEGRFMGKNQGKIAMIATSEKPAPAAAGGIENKPEDDNQKPAAGGAEETKGNSDGKGKGKGKGK